MCLLVFIMLATLLFIPIDMVPLAKGKQWKCFWVYTALLMVTWTVGILLAFKVRVPSPAVPLKKLINWVIPG